MKVIKLISKNVFRHKLRSILTIFGIAIAVMAFGLLRTVVTAWNAGVDASSSNRLISRHAVSFIFPLPYSYRDQLQKIPGVTGVSFANWFQGKYKDNSPDNFFARYAVDAETFMELYPEYILPNEQLATFKQQRNSCIVGKKIADKNNLKVGDIMTFEGDIYPGSYDFTVAGIYVGKDKTIDETQLFFHWSYLDERMKDVAGYGSGNVGWYIINIDDPKASASVSESIDAMYVNSTAKTKTETEKAFQQSFVSLSSAILVSLEVISYVIIGIILLVLANTMIMSARERIREYAVLKTLGFTGSTIAILIIGESLAISIAGGAVGLALTFPLANGFGNAFPTIFPVFQVLPSTILLMAGFALLVGLAASVFPSWKSSRISIVEGLRQIG
ncbi:MAG: ABC transporter permease [Bacteroidetes bacterium]|nr:ABC transporter permease [Bacteroidota bacterium]